MERMFCIFEHKTKGKTKNHENYSRKPCPAVQNHSTRSAHCRTDPDPILRLACWATNGTSRVQGTDLLSIYRMALNRTERIGNGISGIASASQSEGGGVR